MEINTTTLQSSDDLLSLLIQLGEKAKELKHATHTITWECLSEKFFKNAFPPISPASRPDYERWLFSLRSWANSKSIPTPSILTKCEASILASDLFQKGISPARRFRFYKRVWRTADLDETTWNVPEATKPAQNEHYRRLSLREIRSLIKQAYITDHADLADMLIIGYSTGLRLSDVAELERSEILLRRHALKLVPNKVRGRKPNPLLIPLTNEAESVINNRINNKNRYIFGEKLRKHTSRQINQIFKLAKVMKISGGRASFHSLRATFITLMDEAGIQPYITDAITGHAPGGMHSRYTQPSLAVLRKAIIRAIPPLRTRCPRPDSEEGTRLTSLNADRPFAGSVRRKKERTNKMKKLMIAVAAAAMVGGAFAECEEWSCVAVYRIKLSGKSCYAKTLAADKKSKSTCEDSCWLKPCSYRVAGYYYGYTEGKLDECVSCQCQEGNFIPETAHFWDANKKEVKFTTTLDVADILRNGGDKKKSQIGFKLAQSAGELYCAGFGEISYKTYEGGILKGASGFFAGTVDAPLCSSYDEKTCEEDTAPAKAFTPCTLAETTPEKVVAYGRWNLAWKQDKADKALKARNFDCLYPKGFKAADDTETK